MDNSCTIKKASTTGVFILDFFQLKTVKRFVLLLLIGILSHTIESLALCVASLSVYANA